MQNFQKNITVLLLSSTLIIVQLHITDDSHMKDVLQLTTEIVVASSTKKKLKKLKNIQKVVF